MHNGMDFSGCMRPPWEGQTNVMNQALEYRPPHHVVMLSNGEIEIPNHKGYYFNVYTGTVSSRKKGKKFKPGFRYMKIYTDGKKYKECYGRYPKPDDFISDEFRYAELERNTDFCRHKYYIDDIRRDVYKAVRLANLDKPLEARLILPGISFY